jgi:hypothetical protein
MVCVLYDESPESQIKLCPPQTTRDFFKISEGCAITVSMRTRIVALLIHCAWLCCGAALQAQLTNFVTVVDGVPIQIPRIDAAPIDQLVTSGETHARNGG